MNLLEKIKFLKKGTSKKNSNIDNEKIIEDYFKDINNRNIIRLIYIAVESYNSYDLNAKVGITAHVSTPFALPVGLTLNSACKLISYLSNKVEKEQNIKEASMESVKAVEKILSDFKFKSFAGFGEKEYYHATMLDESVEIKIEDIGKELPYVADLITYCGNDFHRTNISKRYFNWYTEDVTFDDVKEIYQKYNINYKEETKNLINSD